LTGLGAWVLSRADSARERIARAVGFAQDSKRPYELAMALLFEGYLYRFQREPRQAEAPATQLLSLSEEFFVCPRFGPLAGHERNLVATWPEPGHVVQANPTALPTRQEHVQIVRDYIWCAAAVVTGESDSGQH
jgi:hypothetical protein